jgi:hypothetical protein
LLENAFVARMGVHSIKVDICVVLAPGYLYVLTVMFALQLYALKLVSRWSTATAAYRLISGLPSLARPWIRDTPNNLSA